MDRIKMISRTLMVVLAFVIVGLLIKHKKNISPPEPPYDPTTSTLQRPDIDFGKVGDFEFTERSGKKITQEDLKGKISIVDFVFTRCMGPCPLMTKKMSDFSKEFLHKSNLQFISLSVDPDFDTPQVLTKYAQTYNADPQKWLFLTGNREKIYHLVETSFKLLVEGDDIPKDGIDILHSTMFVLVNGEGKILGYYNTADSDQMKELKKRVEKLAI
ncbi:MAG: SCO family protein [Elusimicrobiota bacterium]